MVNPLARDPQAVLDDVIDGFVSRDGAHDDYGVVLQQGKLDFEIDVAATAALRGQQSADR